MLWGLLTRKYSRKNLFRLLNSLSIAGKIRKHYEAFPNGVQNFDSWVAAAENLWREVEETF